MEPTKVMEAFDKFKQRKQQLEQEWGTVPWFKLVAAARECAPKV
jgi:hypothetical protein